MAQEYLSKEEVCRILQITPQELDILVSNGEFAHIPVNGQMKFLKSDIMVYKDRKMNEPTIHAPALAESDAEPFVVDDVNNIEPTEPVTDAAFDLGATFTDNVGNDNEAVATAQLENFAEGISADDNPGSQYPEMPENIGENVEEIQPSPEAGSELPEEILTDKELTSEEHLHAAENIQHFAEEDENAEVQLIEETAAQQAAQLEQPVVPDDQQLDINDEGEQYLAELQKEIQEDNETGELKFEVNEGDGMLETGEVLSESLVKDNNQKLPADQEMDNMFHETGEAESLGEKPQTKIVDTIGFEEEATAGNDDDQAVGIAQPPIVPETQEDVPVTTTGGTSTTKMLLLVIVILFLAGAAISIAFFDVSSILGASTKEVELQTFTKESVQGIGSLQANVTNLSNDVVASNEGTIQNLSAKDKVVAKGETIANVIQTKTSPEYDKALTAKNAAEQAVQTNTSKITDYATFMKSAEYKAYVQGVALLRAKKITQAVYTKTYGATATKYAALKKNYDVAIKAKSTLEAALKAATTKLASIKLTTTTTPIVAPEDGKLVEWKVAEKNQVVPNAVVAVIESTQKVQVTTKLPMAEIDAWKTGTTVQVLYQNKPVDLVVQRLSAISDSVDVVLEASADSFANVTNPITLNYAKPEKAVVLPTNCIENNMVWIITEGKADQQQITSRPIWGSSDKVIVDGANDLKIIVNKPEGLQKGTAVKAKN